MLELEKHPLFDPQIKITDVETDKEDKDKDKDSVTEDDIDCAGFAMFEEQAAAEQPKRNDYILWLILGECFHCCTHCYYPLYENAAFLLVNFSFNRNNTGNMFSLM